jgi:DNA-3-methyladenine glycosylase II
MPYTQQNVRAALRHLRAADPVMREIIRRVGPFQLKTNRDRFALLVRSIISQQISGSAARSILARLEATVAPSKPTPELLAQLSPEKLRSAGVSPQKAAYLRDLATRTLDGQLPSESCMAPCC